MDVWRKMLTEAGWTAKLEANGMGGFTLVAELDCGRMAFKLRGWTWLNTDTGRMNFGAMYCNYEVRYASGQKTYNTMGTGADSLRDARKLIRYAIDFASELGAA
jgi:hypothetical protein